MVNKLKPFLVTAGIALVVLVVVFRVAPVKIRQAIIGA